MKRHVHWIDRAVRLALLGAWFSTALAGGSGLNVAVVVNQPSPDSLALGNYYCERRHVPARNLVRINWAGGRVYWTRKECQGALIEPLAAALTQRGLTGQIDYVVLSMDIPYRVYEDLDMNSTTSTLFYGFKTNDWRSPSPCQLSPEGDHDYFASELPFRPRLEGADAPRLLATMVTADTLAEAQRVIDRGVVSDASFPSQTALLQKTSDPVRSVRHGGFDNAVFQARLAGQFPLLVTNSDQTLGWTGLMGLQTGLARFELSPETFVPGAIADSLTSLGGYLFEYSDQTNLLAFLRAGATASYGTVVEPCNYVEKFPDSSVYFYQTRGFALAECYYQSIASPYQGLVVGEPLASPCAQPGQGTWLAADDPALQGADRGPRRRPSPHAPPPPGAPVLAGVTNLSLTFAAADSTRPLDRVDLFVDGLWVSTLTNLLPAAGNTLNVKINNLTIESTVPSEATREWVATNLTQALNAQSEATQVLATTVGDRVELAFQDMSRSGAEVGLATTQSVGSAPVLTTFVRASQPRFLDPQAQGARSYEVTGSAAADDFLQCTLIKTNGAHLVFRVTNQPPLVSTAVLTRRVLDQINASPLLQGADGVSAEDYFAPSGNRVGFRLIARSPGWAAAQVQCAWEASNNLSVNPGTLERLDENLADLRPRNHLYLTTGSASLELTFPFDTATYADGFHELTAVAYEGSSVRTQTRATTAVRIRNTSLEANLRHQLAAAEVAVEALLPFEVVANRLAIARIDLRGTGGLLASATNQAAAKFTLDGSALGAGRHLFHALVVASDGASYQTLPVELRLVPREAPFSLAIAGQPPALSWPGVLGRLYEVLSGETVHDISEWEDALLASDTATLDWPILDSPTVTRFYRVQVR
jgi:uncharacterized protein (TIGR03790 family)